MQRMQWRATGQRGNDATDAMEGNGTSEQAPCARRAYEYVKCLGQHNAPPRTHVHISAFDHNDLV